MAEAAYTQAKAGGELMGQQLRKLASDGELGEHRPDRASILRAAADLIEWLSKERDSLIADHDVTRYEPAPWAYQIDDSLMREDQVGDYVDWGDYQRLAFKLDEAQSYAATLKANELNAFEQLKAAESRLEKYRKALEEIVRGGCEARFVAQEVLLNTAAVERRVTK